MIRVGKEGRYEKFQNFIYAHGVLELIFGTDLISATEDIPLGITRVCICEDVYAVAFVFERMRPFPKVGIVVLDVDKEGMDHGNFIIERKPTLI